MLEKRTWSGNVPVFRPLPRTHQYVPQRSLTALCYAAVAGVGNVPWSPLDATRTQKQNSIPAHREHLTNHALAECQLVGLKSLIHHKKIREESLELSYDRQRMGQANLLLQ